jgi:rod shape-determining protein MreC
MGRSLLVSYIGQIQFSQKSAAALCTAMSSIQQECAVLHAENTYLKALLSYVEETADFVLFKKKFDHTHDIIAQVIERYLTYEEQYVLINVGSSSQVSKDMIVIANNAVVGRVVHVYPWYAKVQLITDPQSCIPSYMEHSNVRGIHRGIGKSYETSVERVNHLETVIIGESVFTSGEGLIFPRGYLLGTVVSKVSRELYYEIGIKPALDLHTLLYCLVHVRT